MRLGMKVFYVALLTAAGVAVVGAIRSSDGIDQRAGESASAENDSWRRVAISAGVGATPTPTPPCRYCSMPVVIAENFDNVMPPALPPDWLATNTLGPLPLWVTSNSGVPIPPADTSPNAAFIDDPAVISDKRLDSLHFPLGTINAQ